MITIEIREPCDTCGRLRQCETVGVTGYGMAIRECSDCVIDHAPVWMAVELPDPRELIRDAAGLELRT